MTIRSIIQKTIQQHGPVPFDKFMDMALYYPALGYYNTDRNPIGSEGDFYTMPHLTPVFGAMIAKQLKEMWEILGRPDNFTVVEIGAGNGHLCRSIIQYAGNDNYFADKLKYYIVEKSKAMLMRAKKIVPGFVQFFHSIEDLPEFTGCVLSNELFDNIPFSIIIRKSELMEVFVDHDRDFFEVLKPASEKLKGYVMKHEPGLPEGARMEISQKSADCIAEITAKLKKGFIITIDYGYTNFDVLQEPETRSTLTCYHHHQSNHNPFIYVGEQDITRHINFSILSHLGKLNGLDVAGYVCQANFLRSLGILNYLQENENSEPSKIAAIRFVAELLLNRTSNKFKVLIQYKGISFPRLTGLTFCDREIIYSSCLSQSQNKGRR